MVVYILRRLTLLVPMLLGISVITFLVVRLLPGDIVDVMLGTDIRVTPEVSAQMRRLLGLDEPLPQQYGHWLWDALHGDLGLSFTTSKPVAEALLQRYPVTIELVALSITLAVAVGIPLGCLSAVFQDRWLDASGRLLSLVGLSMPSFWVGTLLVLVFAVQLHWLPVVGFVPLFQDPAANLRSMILPTVTLALGVMAAIVRMTRSSMLEVLYQEYIRTARSKGLKDRVVVTTHAFRNALIPTLTLIGLQVGGLLGGAVIVEEIFSLPGVGTLVINAVNNRDYPIVQGAVLFLTVNVVLVNLVVDVMYAFIDPRIRYG
jgi:peptide/nickel transport system permease protein